MSLKSINIVANKGLPGKSILTTGGFTEVRTHGSPAVKSTVRKHTLDNMNKIRNRLKAKNMLF